jgi:CRP/FNR family transcriptional regulator, cyclic AMP receptor protein
LKTSTPSSQYICNFSQIALREFHSIGISRHYDAREILLREGFPADHLLIICSGRVKVTAASTQGRLLLLRLAGPGDILGLAALQENTLHRVTAETVSPSTIKSIPRAEFVRFMEGHLDVGRTIALALAHEYNSAVLTARRLALHTSAAGKLASTLLDLARVDEPDCDPTHTNLPISFLMPLTHEDLGCMAGLSRETVSRLLTRFRREGHVFQIHDRMILNHPIQMEARYC